MRKTDQFFSVRIKKNERNGERARNVIAKEDKLSCKAPILWHKSTISRKKHL